ARAADAAHRRPRRRGDGVRLGPGQRGRRARGARRRGGLPRRAHRRGEPARRGAGQGGLLRPGRPPRGRRLRGDLAGHGGQRRGDPVAVLAPSSAELLEVHFGVAAAGAVLVAVDPRLPEGPVAQLLERSRARLLVVDAAPAALGTAAARRAGVAHVLVCGPGGSYEAFLDRACRGLPVTRPAHEEDLLSVTYGLGTADQSGAIATTHRAAYLDAVAEVHHARLDTRS